MKMESVGVIGSSKMTAAADGSLRGFSWKSDDVDDPPPIGQTTDTDDSMDTGDKDRLEMLGEHFTKMKFNDPMQMVSVEYSGQQMRRKVEEVTVKEESLDYDAKNSTIKHFTGLKCSICDKIFARKNTLNRHQAVHSGTKPHKCEICGNAFSQKTTLMNHERIHSGEKPFTCAVCGKAFCQRTTLENHLRLHTGYMPFQCKKCDRKFTNRHAFNYHLTSHSGQASFRCPVCNKAFRCKSNLYTHEKIHKK